MIRRCFGLVAVSALLVGLGACSSDGESTGEPASSSASGSGTSGTSDSAESRWETVNEMEAVLLGYPDMDASEKADLFRRLSVDFSGVVGETMTPPWEPDLAAQLETIGLSCEQVRCDSASADSLGLHITVDGVPLSSDLITSTMKSRLLSKAAENPQAGEAVLSIGEPDELIASRQMVIGQLQKFEADKRLDEPSADEVRESLAASAEGTIDLKTGLVVGALTEDELDLGMTSPLLEAAERSRLAQKLVVAEGFAFVPEGEPKTDGVNDARLIGWAADQIKDHEVTVQSTALGQLSGEQLFQI